MSSLLNAMEEGALEIKGLVTKIKIKDKNKFSQMIKSVAEICPANDSHAVLTMFKLDVKKKMPKGNGEFHPVNALFLTGSNGLQSLMMGAAALEGSADAVIESDREASILIPAKTFAGMLSKMPGGDLFLELEDSKVTLKSGKAKYSLATQEPTEYPSIEMPAGTSIILDAQTFVSALKATAYAISKNESQGQILCGVHVRSSEHGLMFEATDRSRAALEIMKDVAGEVDLTLSGASIKIICEVFKDAGGEVKVFFGNNAISIATNGTTVISKVLDGQYPNLAGLFPKTSTAEFTVNREGLGDIFDRSVALIGKDKSAVDVEMINGELHISAKGELGSGNESIPVTDANGQVKIRLSPVICIDALNNLAPSERIRIKIKDALSPVLIEAIDDSPDQSSRCRQAVVAPIRTQGV